jgi:anti-sigma regulatory factor (Ser/Thr protein kinase)
LRRQELVVELATAELHPAEIAWFLTDRLADAGCCGSPERRRRTELALEEALLNAVEHGNLELDSRLRSADAARGDPYEVLRDERLADPTYALRKVRIALRVDAELATLEVTDDGTGFVDSAGAGAPSADPGGRGLELIRRAFEHVEHEGSTLVMKCRREGGDAIGHYEER